MDAPVLKQLLRASILDLFPRFYDERAILDSCERAARAEGFSTLALMATLPGEPLYRAFGFREVGRSQVTMPDGVSIECVAMERPVDRSPSP